MKITKTERAILVYNLKILKILKPEESEEYQQKIDILSRGFTYLYEEVLGISPDPEIPEETCKFAWDVLTMYRYINNFIRDNPDSEVVNHHYAIFPGFDASSESEYFFVAFIINERKDFSEQIEHRKQNDNFNSHCEMGYIYRRMLKKFEEFRSRINTVRKYLTEKEVLEILNAPSLNE